MSTVDFSELTKKRKDWVRLNKENGFDEGISNLLTELYPDNAHFIYELLQNAEDAGATEVEFKLLEQELEFIHNGRVFNYKDLEGVTSIGQGTKANDVNKIGKFGVGFKAVFAYTSTPKIYSGKYHFQISDLVIPEPVESIDNGDMTVMIFPFNHQHHNKKKEKTVALAYKEIKDGLERIQDNSLLFLSSIKIIRCIVNDTLFSFQRNEINNIKVNIIDSRNNATSQWLRFKKYLPESDTLYVSVAFALEIDEEKYKEYIKPIDGEVSIFFPAEKEKSNLKFHIHAPFASTVARDSIKDIKENGDLRDLIAELICESLEYIKENKLLDFSFLKCMPIEDDNLSPFYNPMQDDIIEYFKNNPYILTDDGTYKPALQCYRSTNTIKDIVDIDMLKKLLYLDEVRMVDDISWVKNPSRKSSRESKFLQSLGIEDFKDEEFLETLGVMVGSDTYEASGDREENYGDLVIVKDKSDEWFGKLYAYCYKQHKKEYPFPYDFAKLIKLYDNSLNLDNEQCYFYPCEFRDYKIVKESTYEYEQASKDFLQEVLEVQVIDERKIVNVLLKDNYSGEKFPNEQDHIEHMKSFLKYYKAHKSDVEFFNKYKFIFATNNSGSYRRKVNHVYIDEPFEKTGLEILKDQSDKIYFLDDRYQQLCSEDLKLFLEFLKKLGAKCQLEIEGYFNMDDRYSYGDSYSERSKICPINVSTTSHGTFRDYRIADLDSILSIKKKEVSLLVWKAATEAKTDEIKAYFKANARSNAITSDSSFILQLKKYSWIPDKNGNFHKPQNISKDMLPDEFAYDDSNGWLTAIGFGENIRKSHAKYKEKEESIRTATGFSLGKLEEAKEAGITDDDLEELIKGKEAQKLKNSIEDNQGNGKSEPFVQSKNNPIIIIDDGEYQKNINDENKNNSNSFVESSTKYKRQNSQELKRIEDFLYKEYEGHCQICGDTFADNGKNVFKIRSLNVGKDRDVSRKGNSLSLCYKHHEILKRKLHQNVFLEKMDDALDLGIIGGKFAFEEFASKEDINTTNDSFYRLNDSDDFVRDVYFLPIMLFGKEEYIKFTEAHMMEFIVVWNNN